jgi:hypothetical protein
MISLILEFLATWIFVVFVSKEVCDYQGSTPGNITEQHSIVQQLQTLQQFFILQQQQQQTQVQQDQVNISRN